MALISTKNYFLEAIKQEFDIKEIRVDNMNHRVVPLKYHPPFGRAKVEYPPLFEWTFDGKFWWSYVPSPMFKHERVTMGFFSDYRTVVDYDESELIEVIRLSKTCQHADELNYKLHGKTKPPSTEGGYIHVN